MDGGPLLMAGLSLDRSKTCGRGARGAACSRRADTMRPTTATQPPSAAMAIAGMKMAHKRTATTTIAVPRR